MRKPKKLLIFSILSVFAFGIMSQTMFKATKLKADTSSVSTTASTTTKNNYLNYVEEKTQHHNQTYTGPLTPSLETPIVIYGSDYDLSKSQILGDDEVTRVIKNIDITEELYNNSNSAANGKTSIALQDGGKIVYSVNVEKAGFYNLYLNYFTIEGYSSAIERSLLINNVLPFESCSSFSFSRIWKDKPGEVSSVVDSNNESIKYNTLYQSIKNGNIFVNKPWKQDTNKNDIKPQQIEVYTKTGSYFDDEMGYETEPYEFYFEQGVNTISLDYTKEPIVIDTIEIRSVEKETSYADYYQALTNKHGNVSLENSFVRIEAEASATKSSPTLYPITDRSSATTTPFSITKTKLNSIGGDNWKVLGDWISWEFSVPASGYYEISMRAKQNMVRGMFSTRSVSIAESDQNGQIGEYKILFDELNAVQIAYNNKWKNVTLGNDDEDFLFYFEKGKTYSLKMEVTLGDYAPLISRLQDAIDELSAIYRRIIAYTTTSPDADRDYSLTKKFPDLFYGLDENNEYTVENKGEFYQVIDELKDISKTIKDISGGGSDKTGVIDSVVVIIEKFVSKPRTIPQRLNTYSTNVSSLGSLLNQLREAPLAIDYIEIHTPDVKLPKANANFFKNLWKNIASFFASFFIDYSEISNTENNGEDDTTIEVWMTLGRDQANVIRNLIDTQFSGENGYAMKEYGKNINVDLKLTGADVLLKATLAGIGPDVALNVDSSLPVNYALRNAVLDLTEFDDFWEKVYAIPDNSIYNEAYNQTYVKNLENVYMASSIRQFQFSPEGAKDEWFDSEKYTSDELKAKIKNIYALPEKQIFLMMFVRDDVLAELGLSDMVPETWDDMLDLVAQLQAQQLQFYLPVNELGATALNPVFVSLLYQYGGSIYTSNNMECGLRSEAAMDAFEFWTKLYTNYSFPTSASFVNRFRTGEMPIGIAYYEMYNTLSVFAPELKGKWSFNFIPGTRKTDELGNTYIDHTATASGTGAVILKQPALKSEEIKNASWTFLKWWTGASAQSQFGREMEGILGSAARHATANVKALQSLAWPAADLKMLMKQWSQVHEMPQIAGSYITGREVENAFREVINNFYNPRETLYEYSLRIDDEINRKRSEFNLPLLDD